MLYEPRQSEAVIQRSNPESPVPQVPHIQAVADKLQTATKQDSTTILGKVYPIIDNPFSHGHYYAVSNEARAGRNVQNYTPVVKSDDKWNFADATLRLNARIILGYQSDGKTLDLFGVSRFEDITAPPPGMKIPIDRFCAEDLFLFSIEGDEVTMSEVERRMYQKIHAPKTGDLGSLPVKQSLIRLVRADLRSFGYELFYRIREFDKKSVLPSRPKLDPELEFPLVSGDAPDPKGLTIVEAVAPPMYHWGHNTYSSEVNLLSEEFLRNFNRVQLSRLEPEGEVIKDLAVQDYFREKIDSVDEAHLRKVDINGLAQKAKQGIQVPELVSK